MAKRGPKKTTAQWITDARNIHGHRFDYSNTEYSGVNNHVTIVCPTHGEFSQVARDHLRGSGCPKCSSNQKQSKSQWIKKAQEVHGDKYQYHLVEYTTNDDKVEIVCPHHGSFFQRPVSHTSAKHGCPLCNTDARLTGISHFIDFAKQVHGHKYDYSHTSITNVMSKCTIICPDHGPFKQRPNDHTSGYGCPVCANQNRIGVYSNRYFDKYPSRKNINALLYFLLLSNEDEMFVKVGITVNLPARINNIQPYNVDILCTFDMTLHEAFDMEQSILHDVTVEKYYPNFYFGGHTECLTLNSFDAIMTDNN